MTELDLNHPVRGKGERVTMKKLEPSVHGKTFKANI